MSTTTSNLGLVKQAGSEKPSLDAINGNWDKIDAAAGPLSKLIYIGTSQPAYSSTYKIWFNPSTGAVKVMNYLKPDYLTEGGWGWRELTFIDENGQGFTTDAVNESYVLFQANGVYRNVLTRKANDYSLWDTMEGYGVSTIDGYNTEDSWILGTDNNGLFDGVIVPSAAKYLLLYDYGDTWSIAAYDQSYAKVNITVLSIEEEESFAADHVTFFKSYSGTDYDVEFVNHHDMPVYIKDSDPTALPATLDPSDANYLVVNGEVTVL